jgi:membrane-associated phospholipid phosphatase
VSGALAWIDGHDQRLARQLRLRPLPLPALRAASLVSGLNGPVCVLAASLAAATGRWRLLLALALAVGAGGLALVQLKSRLPRRRPCDGEPHPHAPRPVLHFRADAASFPSGHAVVASALTLTVLPGWPALGLALVPFLLLVTAARVALGHHYLSDMVAGLFLGCAAAVLGRLLL